MGGRGGAGAALIRTLPARPGTLTTKLWPVGSTITTSVRGSSTSGFRPASPGTTPPDRPSAHPLLDRHARAQARFGIRAVVGERARPSCQPRMRGHRRRVPLLPESGHPIGADQGQGAAREGRSQEDRRPSGVRPGLDQPGQGRGARGPCHLTSPAAFVGHTSNRRARRAGRDQHRPSFGHWPGLPSMTDGRNWTGRRWSMRSPRSGPSRTASPPRPTH